MITCRLYREGALQDEAPFDPEVVAGARDAKERVWVDVIDPTHEELQALQSEFSLHELAVEDSRKWGQRSKVDFYPEHLFLVAHGLGLDDENEIVDREVFEVVAARLRAEYSWS